MSEPTVTQPDFDAIGLQATCDWVVKQLVNQGERSASNDSCLYGDYKGRHCAIGWLMAPDSPAMSVVGPLDSLVDYLKEREKTSELPDLVYTNFHAFKRLQDFHDSQHRATREMLKEILLDEHKIDTKGQHWQQWIDLARYS